MRPLVRNWRKGRAELDLVLWDREILVFCEVKSSSTDSDDSLMVRIDQAKRRALHRSIQIFLNNMHPPPTTIRVDAVEVRLCNNGEIRVRHYPDISLTEHGIIIQEKIWFPPNDIRF